MAKHKHTGPLASEHGDKHRLKPHKGKDGMAHSSHHDKHGEDGNHGFGPGVSSSSCEYEEGPHEEGEMHD